MSCSTSPGQPSDIPCGCDVILLLSLTTMKAVFVSDCQESPVTSKRRVHFLDFMLDVHQRMHKCRQRGISGEVMVSTVTDEILEEGWLLCFDEMQVL